MLWLREVKGFGTGAVGVGVVGVLAAAAADRVVAIVDIDVGK